MILEVFSNLWFYDSMILSLPAPPLLGRQALGVGTFSSHSHIRWSSWSFMCCCVSHAPWKPWKCSPLKPLLFHPSNLEILWHPQRLLSSSAIADFCMQEWSQHSLWTTLCHLRKINKTFLHFSVFLGCFVWVLQPVSWGCQSGLCCFSRWFSWFLVIEMIGEAFAQPLS